MNIGIIGAGTIVPDFLEASSHIEDMNIIGICGQENDVKRMDELASKYSITTVYTDYQKLLADHVDIIYVAVPNHLHYTIALEALKTKKHVILEKPFASNYQEAKHLIEVAKEHQVIIFEAISNQYLPNYLETKKQLPKVGDVKIVQLNYSQYSRRYDVFKEGTILPVFDPEKSGGALMDLNVYNIHYLVGLFGSPDSIQYHANIEKGIDTSGILTLTYPIFKAVAIAAKDCQAPVAINIQGDQGYIHSDVPANVYDSFILKLNTGEETRYTLNNNQNRLYYELEEFITLLAGDRRDIFEKYNQHTLLVMKILDEARKQVGIQIKGEQLC